MYTEAGVSVLVVYTDCTELKDVQAYVLRIDLVGSKTVKGVQSTVRRSGGGQMVKVYGVRSDGEGVWRTVRW